MSKVNKFFDKVFVINLYDKTARWNKVNSQLKRRKIKAERFIAVDGRCKDQGKKGCIAKLKSFEIAYNLKISIPNGTSLQELVPASSLTIGTILLLRAMVKNKWKRILILEDDVELCRNFEKKFTQGINSMNKKKWDLLYLGCGNKCGHRDIGTYEDRSRKLNKISTVSKVLKESPEDSIYVRYKNDLRNPCEVVKCNAVTPNISRAPSPGGTWAYGITLAGARKVLKIIGKDVGVHIDQVYKDYCDTSKLNCVAFDPPVIWHQDGYFRTDTDIPWLD